MFREVGHAEVVLSKISKPILPLLGTPAANQAQLGHFFFGHGNGGPVVGQAILCCPLLASESPLTRLLARECVQGRKAPYAASEPSCKDLPK
jgi:hypothetical protein